VTSQAKAATKKGRKAADKGTEEASQSARDAADSAGDAAEGATGTLREQAVGALSQSARDIVGPAFQQMSEAAAEQASAFAREQAPRIFKEQVLPQIMKSVGAETPGDLVGAGMGKVGEAISGAGGLTGMAGKMLSKVGGRKGKGKGGGQATGYGVKRRMPVQQDVFVSVPVEEAFKGWTEYKRWTEFMFRANQVDPQIEDEEDGEGRVRFTEKMWGFKRQFTAQIESQVANEHIRWKSTDGTKHVGVIAFHELGDRLTLISVNVDHGPSGPVEKIARGARFDKRAIRADLHRFKGWIEMKSPEDIEEIEGWLGTIEDGKVTQTHEAYLEEQGEEIEPETPDPTEVDEGEATPEEFGEPAGDEEDDDGQEVDAEDGADEAAEDEEQAGRRDSQSRQGRAADDEEDLEEGEAIEEDEEPEDEADEEDEEEEEEEEEEERPMPRPKARPGARRKKSAAKKR
jgi:uncharacterized membrane protein